MLVDIETLQKLFGLIIDQNLVVNRACKYFLLIRVFLKLFRIPQESDWFE